MGNWREKVVVWLAWHLPRSLVYWAAVRVVAHATTGRYGNEVVPAVVCVDALQRWRVGGR